MRILFLVSAHNSLSQRAFVALAEHGHQIDVAVVGSAAEMETAVAAHRPELIVCPMLKTIIPESIWSRHRCLVVHPGPVGDRGPSSLDWAIELGMHWWGVTVIEANGEVDGGRVWACRDLRMRDTGKSSLYRHEVRSAAVDAVVEAVTRVESSSSPEEIPLDERRVTGEGHPLMTQLQRAINWESDPTEVVLRKIRAAEGHPGVLDTIASETFLLFGGHREEILRGRPGEVIAHRAGAICRATVDGAVWITHLKRRRQDGGLPFKLPAVSALEDAGHRLQVPEVPAPVHSPWLAGRSYRDIWYDEWSGVGYLHFDFYNGAMSTAQCGRLLDAYRFARSRRQTQVIVLMGGDDFFSNGIHLNLIEAAEDPAEESWRNLKAMNDVVKEIIETDSHLVISALSGDAAAGGVPLALAADQVVARRDVVLNPYYRHMGGLYGSEYWTYLLPRRVGDAAAARLTSEPFAPVGTRQAVDIGLLDEAFGATTLEFQAEVRRRAARLARRDDLQSLLRAKAQARMHDENAMPLAEYCREELLRSHACFFGPDRSYHAARRRFVYKGNPPADDIESVA